MTLSFDSLANAARCPLPPDSRSSTPEIPQEKLAHQYKLIQIDQHTYFYLIRSTNKPYIPCFNLARLLHLTESDILAENVIPPAADFQPNKLVSL